MGAQPLVIATVRRAIQRHSMVARGDVLCVAVSGGPDSTALLSALARLAPELGVHLHVVHLDHGLRGAESASDADAVRSLANTMSLPCTVAQVDVPELERRLGIGTEEAARIARHRFFANVMRQVSAAAVALGHTADDQAETVLMRLIRGTGLRGLAGMRAVTELRVDGLDGPGQVPLRVIRPLLAATRAEVLCYLASERLRYREDSSNLSADYTRNRIRSSVLEGLRSENPRVGEALSRLASSAADDYDYLRDSAQRELDSLVRPTDAGLAVEVKGWQAMPAALRREGLRCMYDRLHGSTIDLTATHVETALECVTGGHVGNRVDWPNGLSLVVGYGEFTVGATSRSVQRPSGGPRVIDVPGRLDLCDGRTLVSETRSDPCAWSRHDRCHADLSASSIQGRLMVRRRLAGDRMTPLGMSGSRKIQDLLVDARVPRAKRDSVPVIEDDSGIVWLAGVRQAERCRVGDATRSVVCLRLLDQGPS